MEKKKWLTLLLTIILLLNVALCIWNVNLQKELEELKFTHKRADQNFLGSFSDLLSQLRSIPADEADWDVWYAEGLIYAESCWNQLNASSYAGDEELNEIFHELTVRFTFPEGAPSETVPKNVVDSLGRLLINPEDSALKAEIYTALCEN